MALDNFPAASADNGWVGAPQFGLSNAQIAVLKAEYDERMSAKLAEDQRREEEKRAKKEWKRAEKEKRKTSAASGRLSIAGGLGSRSWSLSKEGTGNRPEYEGSRAPSLDERNLDESKRGFKSIFKRSSRSNSGEASG
jgi:hypothetical protein